MLENVQQRTIKPLIQATIALGTCIYTDEYSIYFSKATGKPEGCICSVLGPLIFYKQR